MGNHCSYAVGSSLVITATKGVEPLVVFLRLHLRKVADTEKCLTERILIASDYLVVRILWDMNITSQIVNQHAKSRRPCLVDSYVHIFAFQIEFPHVSISSAVENQRDVEMHSAIASDLPAPHVAHICVMNATILISALFLRVLDLSSHRCNELCNDFIAAQCSRRKMTWNKQIKSHYTDVAMAIQRAIQAIMDAAKMIGNQLPVIDLN